MEYGGGIISNRWNGLKENRDVREVRPTLTKCLG